MEFHAATETGIFKFCSFRRLWVTIPRHLRVKRYSAKKKSEAISNFEARRAMASTIS